MPDDRKGNAPETPDRATVAMGQWARERPDLDAFPMAVLGRLGEFSQRAMRERLSPLFNEHGLQPGEFDVLATLRRSGAPYALTAGALSAATLMSTGGMTSRIDRLERAGWTVRRPHPEDRRVVMVALTDAGFDLIDRIIGPHVDNERALLAPLSPAEQKTLDGLLVRLLAGLDR